MESVKIIEKESISVKESDKLINRINDIVAQIDNMKISIKNKINMGILSDIDKSETLYGNFLKTVIGFVSSLDKAISYMSELNSNYDSQYQTLDSLKYYLYHRATARSCLFRCHRYHIKLSVRHMLNIRCENLDAVMVLCKEYKELILLNKDEVDESCSDYMKQMIGFQEERVAMINDCSNHDIRGDKDDTTAYSRLYNTVVTTMNDIVNYMIGVLQDESLTKLRTEYNLKLALEKKHSDSADIDENAGQVATYSSERPSNLTKCKGDKTLIEMLSSLSLSEYDSIDELRQKYESLNIGL